MASTQSPANDSPPRDSHIVIIEPCTSSQNVSKFLADDVAIAKSVHHSPFKLYLLATKKNYAT